MFEWFPASGGRSGNARQGPTPGSLEPTPETRSRVSLLKAGYGTKPQIGSGRPDDPPVAQGLIRRDVSQASAGSRISGDRGARSRRTRLFS